MPKTRNAPDQEQLFRLLWRAHRAAERAANEVLGLNDEGEAYAKVIVRDYRLHECFHFTPLPRHSPLSLDDGELTEQRFTEILRLAQCNLACATEQLRRAMDDFERWLERRRKRDALVSTFAKQFKISVAFNELVTALHEGSARLFQLDFGEWDGRSTFNPAKWAQTTHDEMDRFAKEKQRRFVRLVLHLENGLRVYGIYQRELPDVAVAIEACRERILQWRTELRPENLPRRRFGRFLAFKSKTEFIRKTRAAIRRNEEKIRKLEAIAERLSARTSRSKTTPSTRAHAAKRNCLT